MLKPRRGSLTIYIILLILVLGTMWLLRECHHRGSSTTDAPSGSDTIDVAIQYGPLSFYQDGDTLAGFNYDLLRAIAREGNLRLKFHPVVTLSTALDGLEDGIYDVVVADIPSTAFTSDRFAHTRPVYLDRLVLVQHADPATRINSQLDLAGREVWTVAGSPAVERLHHLAAEIGDTIIVRRDSLYGPEQLFILTATGEIPMAVINERTAMAMAADYPYMDISTGISFNQFQSWLVRSDDNRLRETLDTLLVQFAETPAYRELTDRYMPD